jgi:trehalose 6-phosphate phosphatase
VALTVDRLRSLREHGGIFLDFDGTLAEIAPTPGEVSPEPGTFQVLTDLVASFALVAVVTGRRGEEIRRLVPVDGLEVFGVYGLEHAGAAGSARVHLPELERIAASVPGAWVEDKGVSLTVHYRSARDPDAAGEILGPAVEDLARREGLALMVGKRAIEVAPDRVPGKGAVIAGEVKSRGLSACLYAGDDLADLDAFAALEQLQGDGMETMKIAVRSEETPPELIASADVVVERPAGLVRLLKGLPG